MSRFTTLALAGIILHMSVLHQALPQETAGSPAPAVERPGKLYGHTFIPTTFIRDPFIRTYLRAGMGFGLTPEITTPPFTIGQQTVTGPKGSLLFGIMVFGYQHAIRDWLAVEVGANVIGRLADETRPLLAQGVTLSTAFELGFLATVSKSDRHSLSASATVVNTSITDIYLRRFLEGILDADSLDSENELVETTPVLRGGAGLHLAYAISRLVGLTVSGKADYGESIARDDEGNWYYTLVVAFDFNLRDNGGPAIGFVAGAKTGTAAEVSGTENQSSQSLFGRIAYTGSQDFALGLDLSYDFIPIRNIPEKQGFVSGLVDVRLYF